MTPDVNVLIAAYRSDHVHHRTARLWLDGTRLACAGGKTTLVLLPMVMTGFLRLVTNPRVFHEPDDVEDAVAFLDALVASPGIQIVAAGSEWPVMRGKLLGHGLGGNWVTDAWIAATVELAGEHLVTFDHDFQRLLAKKDLTLLEPD